MIKVMCLDNDRYCVCDCSRLLSADARCILRTTQASSVARWRVIWLQSTYDRASHLPLKHSSESRGSVHSIVYRICWPLVCTK